MTPEDEAQLQDIAAEIRGTWELGSYTIGGVTHEVEVGGNTVRVPTLVFGEFVEGDLGCNSITGGENHYDMVGPNLTFDDPVIEAGLCVPERLMTTELALVETVLWSGTEISVSIVGDDMSWFVDGETFQFRRR